MILITLINLICYPVFVVGLFVKFCQTAGEHVCHKKNFKYNKSIYNFTQLSTHVLYFASKELDKFCLIT